MNSNNWIELVGVILAIGSGVAGAVSWYRSTVENEVHRQRDFNHLKNNQEQLSNNLSVLYDQIELLKKEIREEISELKSLIICEKQ